MRLPMNNEEVDHVEFTKMVDMDKDELSVVYGLDVSLLEEYEIKCSQLMNGNFYAIVKVSDDNSWAKVYVSFLDKDREKKLKSGY